MVMAALCILVNFHLIKTVGIVIWMFTAISIYTHLPIPLVIINCKDNDLPEFAHNLFLVDSVAHLDGITNDLTTSYQENSQYHPQYERVQTQPVQYPESNCGRVLI
jgi:hypothetical protein